MSSVSDEDDYIELPAVTKTLEVADGANQTPQPVTHSSAYVLVQCSFPMSVDKQYAILIK